MMKSHDCTAANPCGQEQYRNHCDGCETDVHSLYPGPPNQQVLQLMDAQRMGRWTHWCRPCAVKLLPAALLPQEWRPEPDDGPAHVWLGDLAGFQVSGEAGSGQVALHHRCGWVRTLRADGTAADFAVYLANIVGEALEARRDHDCREYRGDTAPEQPAAHDCPDCVRNGGIGFACGHRSEDGTWAADGCDWCKERGYRRGDPLPGVAGPPV